MTASKAPKNLDSNEVHAAWIATIAMSGKAIHTLELLIQYETEVGT